MEFILHQNFYNVYPSRIKTRRYILFSKMINAPITLISLKTELLKAFKNYQSMNPNTRILLLNSRYSGNNIWTLLKTLHSRKHGSLLNNILVSYIYWTLNYFITNLASFKLPSFWNSRSSQLCLYTKEIRLIKYNFKRQTFNKVTLMIFFALLKLRSNYKFSIFITHSYIIVPLYLNLLSFYNVFYMRVHNF